MKLLRFKDALWEVSQIKFQLPDEVHTGGKFGTVNVRLSVPDHFHITEVGVIHKQFVDCGGTVRSEHVVSLQLWCADDTDHRLAPEKLLDIISIAESKFIAVNMNALEVEVEYQGDTIGKYGVELNSGLDKFLLVAKQTDCLAKEKCGIPVVEEDEGCCGGSECCS